MFKSIIPSTPQGKILLIKFIAGIAVGVLAFFIYGRVRGLQLFFITITLYTLISIALIDLAAKAKPGFNLGFYAFFKGIMTYYVALYLTWLTLNIAFGGQVVILTR